MFIMGIRNAKLEELERLEFKTLDAHFMREVRHGLNCSPFEANAVLQVVREVYLAHLQGDTDGKPTPGQITLVVVADDEPAGKPIEQCEKATVRLTVHRGRVDDAILQKNGPEGFRQARIAELCQQALSQGGILTREDLAYRVFFVSPRTITRDLAALRSQDAMTVIPLRSMRHDIGPVLTHRTQIVRLALEGKTMTQICHIMRHSPEAVANYVSTFTRCAQLSRQNMQIGQIAFLLRRGKGLIAKYVELLAQCEGDKNMTYHLEQLLGLGCLPSLEKKAPTTKSGSRL